MEQLLGSGNKPSPGGSTETKPTVTTPATAVTPTLPQPREQLPDWARYGIPVLAGVASAASAPLARGVQGATHVMTALDKNQDPYGYKSLANAQKMTAIQEHQAKSAAAQRKYDEQVRLKELLGNKYPEHRDLISTLPEENLFAFAQKVTEPPSFNELSLKGKALGFGGDPRRWTPEQSKKVDDARRQDVLDQAKTMKQDAAQVRIDMPAPSRAGGKGGGDLSSKYAYQQNPDTGEWEPILDKDGRPLLKSNVITPTTPSERATTQEGKDKAAKDKAERDAIKQDRKEARDNLKGNFQFKMLPLKKQQDMMDKEVEKIRSRRLKDQGTPPPPSSGTPPMADPLGLR